MPHDHVEKLGRAMRALVAEHLDAMPGAVALEEQREDDVVWMAVVARPRPRTPEAQRAAEGCPHDVARTFEVVGG